MKRSAIVALILGVAIPASVSLVLGGSVNALGQGVVIGLICAVVSWAVGALALRSCHVLWVTATATLVWSITVLDSGVRGLGILLYLVGGFGFGFLTIWTAGVLVIRGVKSGKPIDRILPLPLVGQLLMLIFVFVGITFGVVPKVKFALSRDALEAAALRVQAGETLSVPGEIGAYQVRRVDCAGSAVRFILWDVGLVDEGGLVFSPGQEPPRIGEDAYKHLEGPWWLWWESW